LNHFNPISIEDVMAILLGLHKIDRSCAQLCSGQF